MRGSIENEILKSLDMLDLPILISKSDIKKRYRQLAKKYHPDVSSDNSAKMEQINHAYSLLMQYIEDFRYTFDTEEISRQYPGERHAQKFNP